MNQITGLSFNAAMRCSLCSSGIRMQQMLPELAISAEKPTLRSTLADGSSRFARRRNRTSRDLVSEVIIESADASPRSSARHSKHLLVS
jgi:hypothetical protein